MKNQNPTFEEAYQTWKAGQEGDYKKLLQEDYEECSAKRDKEAWEQHCKENNR